MNVRFKSLAFAGIVALSAVSTAASAAFSVGNAIEAAYLSPDVDTPYVAAVSTSGPTDSLQNYAGFLDITYTDSSMHIRLTRDGGPNHTPFDGVRFTDQVGNLQLESYVANPSGTTISGFTLTSGPNQLFANFAEITGLQGQILLLTASPIPTPASITLLVSALGIVGAVTRRREK